MSIILRPLGSPRLEELSLMGSLAVVEGLRHILPIRLRIRWPNDVVAGEKKLAGVIVEGMTEGIDLTCAVVGIGVNCNAPAAKLGASIPATSLYEELGEKVDLIAVRSAVLGALSGLYTSWLAGDSMKPTWEANVGTLGRDVSIKLKTEENPFSCRAVGVQEDGMLVVEQGRRRFPVAAEDLERLTEL